MAVTHDEVYEWTPDTTPADNALAAALDRRRAELEASLEAKLEKLEALLKGHEGKAAFRYAAGGYVAAGKARILGDTPGESLIPQGMVDATKAGLMKVMPDVVSVPAGIASAQEAVCVTPLGPSAAVYPALGCFADGAREEDNPFPRLTPEARDNIGNAALALQEYSAKAEQEARKAEAEQTTALAIERSMAFR